MVLCQLLGIIIRDIMIAFYICFSHSFAFLFFSYIWNVTVSGTSGRSVCLHSDNALEVCGLLTPLHIVPEWYFLCQYAMLKAIPNKNAGFIILLTSIFILFYFGEIRILIIFIRLMDYNNSFSIIFLLFIFLLF